MNSYYLSDSDFQHMIAGGVLVALAIFSTLLDNKKSFVNLRTIFVVAVWVQYHLSPWLYYATGWWDAWLLKPAHISEALLYSNLAILTVIIAYGRPVHGNLGVTDRFKIVLQSTKTINPQRLMIISVAMSFTAALFQAIPVGLENFLVSTVDRGAHQWVERSLLEQLVLQLKTVSLLLGAGAAVTLGMAYSRLKGFSKLAIAFAIILLLGLASSSLWWKFSRASGALFMLTAMVAVLTAPTQQYLSPTRIKQVRKIPYLFVCIAVTLGVYACVIGITHRSLNPPGLASFAGSMIGPDFVSAQYSTDYDEFGAEENFFDSTAPFTSFTWGNGGRGDISVNSITHTLYILQPLPAGLVGVDVRVGESLSSIYNTQGRLGLTSPALAELYVLHGFWGLAFLALYARLLRAGDIAVGRNKLIGLIIFGLLAGSIVVSGHTGLRASARFFILAAGLLLFANYFLQKPLRRRLTPMEYVQWRKAVNAQSRATSSEQMAKESL